MMTQLSQTEPNLPDDRLILYVLKGVYAHHTLQKLYICYNTGQLLQPQATT